MRTITKKAMVTRISARTMHSKMVVRDLLQAFLDEIMRELALGNRLELRRFGVFEVRQRAARIGRNPRTLEKVSVPPRQVVKFRAARLMTAGIRQLDPAIATSAG